MKRIVLDASAIMAFFENRPGAETVHDLVRLGVEGKHQLFMSVVNWGEAYYSTWRTKGPGVAHHFLEQFSQLPIQLVPADVELARQAAEFKANFNLPYVDGFAAALALQRKASLATSDRDFAIVSKKLAILWTT
jgi:predicted nucleic acid-binding protein